MSLNKFGVLCIFILGLSACTHSIHNYHMSDQAPLNFRQKNHIKKVQTQQEQFVILGFVQQTDYVNLAYKGLEAQCESGSVTGIQTRSSSSHGFFSWTNKIVMTGYCVF